MSHLREKYYSLNEIVIQSHPQVIGNIQSKKERFATIVLTRLNLNIYGVSFLKVLNYLRNGFKRNKVRNIIC